MRRIPGDRPSLRREPVVDGVPKELLLYVEDDDDNWEVAEFRLAGAYKLVRAATAKEACDILRTRRGQIDLILMDIELRGSELNGVELTELLRGGSLGKTREIPAYACNLPPFSKPVIYVTAHGKRYSNVQLMLSGADKVITKPVNFAELIRVIGEFVIDRTHV